MMKTRKTDLIIIPIEIIIVVQKGVKFPLIHIQIKIYSQ